jgi:glucose/mannose transport system substrate-binding protein
MKKLVRFSLAALALLVAAQIPNASFAAAKKLEVFSWWTSGGEAAALDALFQAVKKADPGVEVINATVAGGGGSSARPVLQARLAGGNPPDSWQIHPGKQLLGQYVEANYCEPVTDIYQSEGWD